MARPQIRLRALRLAQLVGVRGSSKSIGLRTTFDVTGSGYLVTPVSGAQYLWAKSHCGILLIEIQSIDVITFIWKCLIGVPLSSCQRCRTSPHLWQLIELTADNRKIFKGQYITFRSDRRHNFMFQLHSVHKLWEDQKQQWLQIKLSTLPKAFSWHSKIKVFKTKMNPGCQRALTPVKLSENASYNFSNDQIPRLTCKLCWLCIPCQTSWSIIQAVVDPEGCWFPAYKPSKFSTLVIHAWVSAASIVEQNEKWLAWPLQPDTEVRTFMVFHLSKSCAAFILFFTLFL